MSHFLSYLRLEKRNSANLRIPCSTERDDGRTEFEIIRLLAIVVSVQYMIVISVNFPGQSLIEIAILILWLQSEFKANQLKFVSLDC